MVHVDSPAAIQSALARIPRSNSRVGSGKSTDISEGIGLI